MNYDCSNTFWYIHTTRRLFPLLMSVALLAALVTPSWGSTYSMQISFTNLLGGATLTNFPALVKLDAGNTDTYTGFLDTTDGWDLRFWTNSALTGSELNYEIEAFDSSGTSFVWVQVPELTQNTSIWASWGNPAYNSQMAYTTNGAVWSEGYEGAWHLNESVTDESTAAGVHLDSTSNRFDGDQSNNGPVAGVSGSAQYFDGSGDAIDFGSDPALAQLSDFTIEAWIKTTSAGAWFRNVLGNFNSADGQNFFALGWLNLSGNPLGMVVRVNNLTTYVRDSTDTGGVKYEDDQWHHFVGTKNGASLVLYVDGVQVGTGSRSGNPYHGAAQMQMGTHNGSQFSQGTYDEARVSSSVRSANWVWASYMNQGANHDAFVEYGPVTVSEADGIVWSGLATSDITFTSAWASATVNTNVDTCVLVWEETSTAPTTATEPSDTNQWSYHLSLPTPVSGVVTGQMTGLSKGINYTWRFFGEHVDTNGWSGPVTFTYTDLACTLSADEAVVSAPSNVVFTAAATGDNTDLVHYAWDFGDGKATNGPTLGLVTNTYSSGGLYTVTLMVSNAVGETASVTNTDYIAVYADTLYVSSGNPSASPPYHTWANAAATIADAVTVAPVGSTIVVSNGTYNTTGVITLDNALTLKSYGNGVYGGLTNAANTVVDRGFGSRVFYISDAGVVLDGVTVTRGGGGGKYKAGKGIYMTGGAVLNCIVEGNGTGNGANDGNAGGGGIAMSGGLVSNCTVRANLIVEADGPGIYATGGTIRDSRILDNLDQPNYTGRAGGIYASSTSVLIRNCLVAGNTADGHGGGIYGGTVENCTVVKNQSTDAASVGGGVYNSTVINSVVMDNTSGSGSGLNYGGSASFSYSCADPLPAGTGNISGQSFEDAASTNYQLLAGAAVDGGINAAWMTNAVDLIGNPRLNGAGGIVDMGAYEKVPGALEAGFSADVTSVPVGSNIVFTAVPSGGNTTLTDVLWSFGDGQIADSEVATNAYAAPGAYTVSLTITNSTGEGASAVITNYIAVWGDYAYVSGDSPAPVAPYHTWSNAAHSLPDAVAKAFAGMTVVVSNGTHSTPAEIVIAKPLTLVSFGAGTFGGMANASNTIVNHTASSGRVLTLDDPGVVLKGLTITGGSGKFVEGKGIYMTGGSVLNCIVKDNGSSSGVNDGNSRGGGIYMTGGVVSNCTVQGNQIAEYDGGAGIYAQGNSQILHSSIVDNKQTSSIDSSGGGIYASGSSVLIRNCLVARNETKNSGGGVYGGTIENCTIVSNRTRVATGGGVYLTGSSSVKNSIVYFNVVGGVHSNLNATAAVAYSCFTNPDDGSNGNIADDPQFADLAGSNYRMLDTSPCINYGDSSIVTWSTDLEGQVRIQNGYVDMGAYEIYRMPRGTLFSFR